MQHSDFFDSEAWDELMEVKHTRIATSLCLVAQNMANSSVQIHNTGVEDSFIRGLDSLDTTPVVCMLFSVAHIYNHQKNAEMMIRYWRRTKIINYYQFRQLAQIVLPVARDDTRFRAVHMAMEIVKHVDLQINLTDYWNIRNIAIPILLQRPLLPLLEFTAAVRDQLFCGRLVYSGDEQRVRIVCEALKEVGT